MKVERFGNVQERTLDQLEQRARALNRAQNLGREAERVNSRILEQDPRNSRALVRRGRCRFELGDLSAARDDFRRAREANPENTVAQRYLERIDRAWGDWMESRAEEKRREGKREGRRQERHAEFREVKAIETYQVARDLGDALRAEDPELAAAAYWRALRLDPRKNLPGAASDSGFLSVPKGLALAYRRAEKPRAAEKVYAWLRERRDDRFAKTGHAAVHSDLGRFADAKSLCDEVLVEYPLDPYALNCKGRACYGLREREEAAKAFELAARNSGSNLAVDRAAHRGLEQVRQDYLATGDKEGAERVASVLARIGAAGRNR